MRNTKLILVDGMPGSGKSTTGKIIQERLEQQSIPARFYHELEENHPLRIYDRKFTSFTIAEEAEWFEAKVKELFHRFVREQASAKEIAIVESYIFQDTIGFAYNMGMEHSKIRSLMASIQGVLQELHPVLIYFFQEHVEQNWRWICNIRGPEFTQERCGLFTDEDFVKAGEFWSANQEFVYQIVQEWEIPKLVIRNKDYRWDEYIREITEFLQL
jgi:thymidylate kinase